MYINDPTVSLERIGLGCYLSNVFVGGIFYANDILLMSLSVDKLQRMLDLHVPTMHFIMISFLIAKSQIVHS